MEVVQQELNEFVKRVKKQSKEDMDKHLCDHLLWMIEEYYNKTKE